jgi:3-oxoacyl-[acyl-carrier protein] reductase
MSKLTGKVAVVTGASKGIGAAIAKALAAEGASVVVNYASSKEGAEKVVGSIAATGGKAIAVRGDVSKTADAQGLIDAAIRNYGRLDIVVNNSGIYEFSPLEEITEEAFHKSFNINVLGPLLVTKAAAKHFVKGASVINIGSTAPLLRSESTTVYTATKAALDAVTGVLAKELGPKKIRVNSVNPGFTITEGTGSYVGSDFADGLIAQVPLGRAAQPEEIASVVVFLASDDARWLTAS